MRPPRVLLVCLCVVLAGCGGAVSPTSDDTRTVNPALGETPTTSPTPERWDGPPGVTDSDVSVTTLAAAHQNALANRSVTVRRSTVVVYDNGTLAHDPTVTTWSDRDQQYVEIRATTWPFRLLRNQSVNRSYWRNDSVTVVRQQLTNGSAETSVQSESLPRSIAVDPSGRDLLVSALVRFDLEYAGGTVVEGDSLHVLRAADDATSNPNIENVSIRVLATDAGVVRAATVQYHNDRYGPDREPATVTVRFGLSNVSNTTVPRPAWVADTLANATGES
ncbi:hypothetical protein [Halobaculum limi]|uniref:hypothetical protein n=1 Tax=Halobaculum limi TaxID=3031916 RepID=UPI0024058873|nr:hypothetical protein [Halobaculum sp. YSMS11]